MNIEYCVCVLGGPPKYEDPDKLFIYAKKTYTNLRPNLKKSVFTDIASTPGFTLKQVNLEQNDCLAVFFDPEISLNLGFSYIKRFRVIQEFFRPANPIEDLPISTSLTSIVELTGQADNDHLAEFYQELRKNHENDDLVSNLPTHVQHPKLRPLLRPYQSKAIKWLIKRETQVEFIPSEFMKMFVDCLPDQIFYYNPRTLELYDFNPGDQLAIPSGGILADEMGLGKTVEVLGLILQNPRCFKRHDFDNDLSTPEYLHEFIIEQKFKCLCMGRKKSSSKLIYCPGCETTQHKKCVLKNCVGQRKTYKCPECWKYTEKGSIKSSATLICTPASIKEQWKDEIMKHIIDPNFKVLVYEGIIQNQTSWISPEDLAEYDVVITDFNVLKQEIYFTQNDSKGLRNEKKFISPISPLPMINWWRVCLDEAQMVESTASQSSKMVKTLPAVHRWSISGTPIQKHINDLYGLLYFMGFSPYDDFRVWKKFSGGFYEGVNKDLLEILSKVMWRTCKKDVLAELGIPEQKEVLHLVEMSDLQKFYYTTEHDDAAEMFRYKANKYCRDDVTMSKMNPHTLNVLMEPLRKLRQDCTIPSIFHRSSTQALVKQTLTPDELHVHLIGETEMECKSQLRTITTSINGLAGIHVARNELAQAIKCYKSLLNWANEHQGTITVDSLLRIHALHNLVDIVNTLQDEKELKKTQEYLEECNKLEWKYISNYYEKIKIMDNQLKEQTDILKDIDDELDDKNGEWWRHILYSLDRSGAAFDKIRNSMMLCNGSELIEEVSTVRGMDLVLTTWWQKIQKNSKEIKTKFRQMQYFYKNLKPHNELTEETRNKIDQLVASAFECHLNLQAVVDEDEEGLRSAPKKQKKNDYCDLCKLQDDLDEYECLLFNKKLKDDGPTGSWNPRTEEHLMKVIYTTGKKERTDDDMVATGENHLKYIDAIKNQFKEYSKLWVEMNYTASAYDEMSMCKGRLEVIDAHLMTKQDFKVKQKIASYEVANQRNLFESQKVEAEREFDRLRARLKYLIYLRDRKNDIITCPVCEELPNGRYCVLSCAHSLCLLCFTAITKHSKSTFNCPICRNEQAFSGVYSVSNGSGPSDDNLTIKGSFSSKIDEIIRTVIKLKRDDDDVKILIFSHWDNILNVISNALIINSIPFCANKSNNFTKTITQFKDLNQKISCLLLNLRFGSKGLNLTEATHVFLVEPILNPGEESQAVGRIHRIGQTKKTFVHRFIVKDTIEETIYNTILQDKYGKWKSKDITTKNLEQLFELKKDLGMGIILGSS